MKIGFYDPTEQDFAPDTPYHRPLGGTQSAMCYLSAALAARGHDVSLLCSTSTPGEALGVRCIAPEARGFHVRVMNQFDVLVVSRRPLARGMRAAGVTGPLVLWQHMQPWNFAEGVFGSEENAAWTAVAFVSEHQRDAFRRQCGLDGRVMRNAISPAVHGHGLRHSFFFETPGQDPTLIYASAPGRGLDHLLIAFPSIRAALPAARLRIVADLGLYNVARQDDPYRAYYELARALPGVEFTGSVSQTALAAEFSRADVLSYPTTFKETSCIVALEAMASGCMVATTALGALPETCGDAADFMPMNLNRNELCAEFADLVVSAVERARRDPKAAVARREATAAQVRETSNWARRAVEWEAWLEALP